MAALRRTVIYLPPRRGAVLSFLLAICGVMGLAFPSAKGDDVPNPFDVAYNALVQKFHGANNLTTDDDLFEAPEFVEIWDNPARYTSAALEYLADPAKPAQGKNIATTAMQNLSAKDVSKYITYCRDVVALRKRGAIDDVLLAFQIFNNDRVANLETEEIMRFLKDLKTQKILVTYVDSVLHGEARSREKATHWPLRPDAGG